MIIEIDVDKEITIHNDMKLVLVKGWLSIPSKCQSRNHVLIKEEKDINKAKPIHNDPT